MNTPSSAARPSLRIVQQIHSRIAAAAQWLVELHDDVSDLRVNVHQRLNNRLGK